ncbi:MAG: SIMPL domain-containing protein [Anaerolineae bacterium]|nr:SIMPL domain-containing protein [Anaerolineae bacterium]
MQKQFPLNWKMIGTVVLVIVAVMSIAVGSVGAQDLPANSISVSGSGEAYGTPDVAYVYLGVDTVDANVGAAVDQANKDLAAIIDAVKALGIAAEDIQTANFNVYPEDRYDPQSGQPTGERVYHVQQSLNVTVRDITQAGAVIDAGLGAGADTVNGLSFGIADTTTLEQEARLKAVEDARSRAAELAAAFGVTLGEPIIISEVFGNSPVYPLGRAADAVAMGMGGAAPSQINPGQLSVNVQISVTFAIGG